MFITCHLGRFWMLCPWISPDTFLISLVVFPLHSFAIVTLRNAYVTLWQNWPHPLCCLTQPCKIVSMGESSSLRLRLMFTPLPVKSYFPWRLSLSREPFLAGQLAYRVPFSVLTALSMHMSIINLAQCTEIILWPISPTPFWTSKGRGPSYVFGHLQHATSWALNKCFLRYMEQQNKALSKLTTHISQHRNHI